jgi:hypothetical protein
MCRGDFLLRLRDARLAGGCVAGHVTLPPLIR